MTTSAHIGSSTAVVRLDELMRMAWRGEIRVRTFQQSFRWGREDIVQLMDSIRHGYPVGSLLVWERQADAAVVAFDELTVDAPALDRALWVVDGYQRIATLANVLHPDTPAGSRFALGYDLRTRRFASLPGTENPLVLPLAVLFDNQLLFAWFAGRPEITDQLGAALEVSQQLRDFTFPMHRIRGDDPAEVSEIFERINFSGRRPSKVGTVVGRPVPRMQVHGDFDSVAETIDRILEFGRIDAETLHRCIPTPLTETGGFDPDDIDPSAEGLRAAMRLMTGALTRAVDFVITAGVPHFAILPHPGLLVVLTRFFTLHPEPRPADLRLLNRWFWRAAAATPPTGPNSASELSQALDRVDRNDSTGSLRTLLDSVGDHPTPTPDLREFAAGHTSASIIACYWWSRGPRSPENGKKYSRKILAAALSLAGTVPLISRPLFAGERLQPRNRYTAANHVLLLSAPSGVVGDSFRRRPDGMDADTWSAVLSSHDLTDDLPDLTTDDQVDEFIEVRQTKLEDDLTAFLARKCEWGFENTPPLSDLVLEDLDDDSG